MLVTIYLNRLEELKKVFNRFSKKANAVGLETSLKIGEPYIKEIPVYEYDDIRHCQVKTGKFAVDVVDIDITYPEYKLGDYSVIAVIDHTLDENSNAIYPCGDFDIPVEYRHGQGICEHCRTNHKRNKTILLRDISGKLKQVGTSCLKEYTGVTDYSLVSAFGVIDGILDESNICTGYYTGERDYRRIRDYLACCIHEIRKNGYDRDIKEFAYNDKWYSNSTESDYNTADKVIEYFTNNEFSDNFLYNISVHMKKGYCRENGFIAYAYIAYQKEMEKAEKEKAKVEQAKSIEYYGNVKDKVELNNVTGKVLTSYSNCYGSIYNSVTTYVYQFTDNANHVFIWKSSCDIPLNDEGLFKGSIKGTIKEHSEYRGIKQTVLTRVKVTG